MVVADQWKSEFLPEDQNGYTSRAVGRVAKTINKLYGIDVSYVSSPDVVANVDAFEISEETAVVGVRLQDAVTEEALDALSARGASVWLHGADPHWMNPLLPERSALQTRMLQKVTGVIATSEANADAARALCPETGKPFSENVVCIPDVMDRWEMAPPFHGWNANPHLGCELVTVGYPFHSIGFADCAEEVAAYAAANKDYLLELDICTKKPNASQAVAHAPQKPKADGFDTIDALRKSGAPVYITSYSVDVAREMHELGDLLVLPNDPLERLNVWQQMRYWGRGSQRVVDGFAAGLPVLVIGQNVAPEGLSHNGCGYPRSYLPFIEAGALLTASSVTEGIDLYRTMDRKDLAKTVAAGQAIVRANHHPEIVAQRYVETLFPRG